MDELDTFLDGELIDAPTETEVAELPETPVQPRDESGRFAPKQTGVETPPQPEAVAEPVPPTEQGKLPQDVYEPLRAVRDENKALKAQLEALQTQFQSLQQPQQAPQEPPSVFEDEQAWSQHFGSQVAQQAAFNARLDTSEMLASQAHADFDEMKAKFLEMAQANPMLVQQALQAKHPWEKAYQIAANAAKMEQLGAVDVNDLEAKLREQITAELAAQQPAPAPTLPASLADQQSSRIAASAPSAPLSLKDILGI
jgi:hypothetical protein